MSDVKPAIGRAIRVAPALLILALMMALAGCDSVESTRSGGNGSAPRAVVQPVAVNSITGQSHRARPVGDLVRPLPHGDPQLHQATGEV